MERKAASVIMLTLLLTSLLTLAFSIQLVRASGTIYIRADGSVDPPTAPIQRDGDLYTLTADIFDSIVVERDNMTLDGTGYALQGPGYGVGVYLSGRSNVTIREVEINSFYDGIFLDSSSNNTIVANIVTESVYNGSFFAYPTGAGIFLRDSSNYNTVVGNNATANDWAGIFVESSSFNTLYGNTLTKQWAWMAAGVAFWSSSNNNTFIGNNVSSNYWGVHLQSSSYNTIARNNVTDNITLGIKIDQSNYNIVVENNVTDNWGDAVGGYASYYNTISGNNITANSGGGMRFESYFSYNTVIGNNVTGNNGVGIWLVGDYNAISGNYVRANTGRGIMVPYGSSNNIIVGNNITANSMSGIEVEGNYYVGVIAWNNTVIGNNVEANGGGIELISASNNTVVGNNITANSGGGIGLSSSVSWYIDSRYNRVIGNNVTANGVGINLYYSYDDVIYHNNFINNPTQVLSTSSVNTWDDGYPSGGNTWSNYAGVDLYRGPYQNETGSDGIGDTPYVIDADNRDNYPLMNPWTPPDIAIINVIPSKTVVGQGFTEPVNITITNQGNKIEGFTLTLHVNQTNIQTQYIILTGGSSTTITLNWNTTAFAKGKYTISAYAWPVPGETDTADNAANADSTITVAMPWDIANRTSPDPGTPDGIVNYKDVFWLLKAYGSDPTKPNWNPNCDVAGGTTWPPAPPDNIVNYKDAFWLLKYYLQVDP